ADRLTPHLPLVRVGDAALERVAGEPARVRGGDDALGVEAIEEHAKAASFPAEQPIGADLDAVEEDRELALGNDDLHRDGRRLEALRAHVDEEERELPAPGARIFAGAGDDEHRVRLVDAADVDLLPVDDVALALPPRARPQRVRVGARVRLGQREADARLSARETRQPARLLLVAAVAREQRPDDRGRDDEQEQRAAGGGELFADEGELRDTEPSTAVLLREAHAQKPLPRELV